MTNSRSRARAVRSLRASSPAMARAIDRVGPCALAVSPQEPYRSLLRSIVYQQLAGSAASAILARVLALFPGQRPTPSAVLAAAPEQLRGAGLSRAKEAAIRDLSRRAKDGGIPSLARARNLSNEALVEQLTVVRGIGRWTVEMFLIFCLGREDVWPALDFGVRKGLARILRRRRMPTPKEAVALGERFVPYRSVAAWYCWQAAAWPDARRASRAVTPSRRR